jgi:glycosyltransferase involved in cell wall biosynthesis
LLFIGTLNYPPNEDAVGHFCSDILPLIRRKFLHPVRIRIVGAVPSPGIVLLSRRYPDVEVVANVPDLAPYYAEADVVIVPLRAGSGTRIKILEAFSFGRPVVSTTIGAEGLALKNREQLLIADEPEAFAGACVELLEDPALCARITKSAQTWLLAHHSLDRVTGVIRSLYAPVLSPSVTESAWRLDSA